MDPETSEYIGVHQHLSYMLTLCVTLSSVFEVVQYTKSKFRLQISNLNLNLNNGDVLYYYCGILQSILLLHILYECVHMQYISPPSSLGLLAVLVFYLHSHSYLYTVCGVVAVLGLYMYIYTCTCTVMYCPLM